jgi:hypothetical protein
LWVRSHNFEENKKLNLRSWDFFCIIIFIFSDCGLALKSKLKIKLVLVFLNTCITRIKGAQICSKKLGYFGHNTIFNKIWQSKSTVNFDWILIYSTNLTSNLISSWTFRISFSRIRNSSVLRVIIYGQKLFIVDVQI